MENSRTNKNGNDDLQYLLLRINNKYASLTKATRRIADYLLTNYEEALYLNISEFAEKCHVSESTITKFIKTIGYKSYRDLKISLARNTTQTTEQDIIYWELSLNDKPKDICRKVFNNDIDALQNTLRILDSDMLDKAAEMILKARDVVFYGIGSAVIALNNASLRFYRLGIRVFTYNDPHEQIVSASLLNSGDVAIGISNSGRSPEVVKALRIAKGSGAKTICITNYDKSPITEFADIKLFTSSKDSEEINESLQSRIAEIALIDALYICVASKMKKRALENLYKTNHVLKEHKTITSD